MHTDFWLQNWLASDLLDFQNKLLVPLLILFFHVMLRVYVLFLCEFVLVKRVIQPRAICLVTYGLIKHFFNELVLQWLIVQVNVGQNLLDLVVVGLVGVHIQFCQDVLLLGLLEHLEHRINELKRGHCFPRKLLIRPLFLLGLLGDLCDELVHLVVGVEVYCGEVLLKLVAVGFRQ